MSRLSHLSEHSAAAVCKGPSSLNARCLPGGEDDVSLYPGQNTTGLCPTVQFSGAPVYLPQAEPDETEVRARVERYWRPYHRALAGELQRMQCTFVEWYETIFPILVR